ncbi:tetratricopeptide repeat protein [Thermospira aquatica]|uniref:Tetratricopeptide repeat protein n=1 Tax=Thermospira aquatica TaxID=2828656 RepID=A0AAX3BFY6_9SPIR|nr:tetratricopeptide repeat protein [Thermospira aquatica]URA11317.1 tetratricopeptide repeat protein [Thermospira aquatica]
MKRWFFIATLFLWGTVFAQETETETPTTETPKIEESAPAESISETRPTPAPSLSPQIVEPKRPALSPSSEDRLLQAIQANPTDRNAYNRLLDYYRSQNRTEDHLKILIKAIQNVGGNLNYYLLMGDDYMTLGDYSKAIISYQYAVKEAPSNPVCYLKLGNAHLAQKNYYSAETALLAALHYGEASGKINVAFASRLLGECYEGVKNYQESLKWYQKAYRLSPTQEYKAFVNRIQALTNQ